MTVGAVGAGHNVAWTGAGNSGQDSRVNTAVSYFISQGWSREQAVGIVANLVAESGVDPQRAQNGGGPGYGIGQWEGPRQGEFARWAGHDIHGSSLHEQLAFVQYELSHGESGAAARLRGADSAGDAAAIVCRYYERPADTVGQSRYRAGLANDIFAGARPGSSPMPAADHGVASTASSATQGEHVIRRGDTLWSIAMRNGISLASVIRANSQFSNPDYILPGQTAHLPGAAGAGAAGTTGGVDLNAVGNTGPASLDGTDAASAARHYLGRYQSDLQRAGVTLDCPTNVSCANFVTSMLVESGQFSSGQFNGGQRLSVHQMSGFLQSQGWQRVPAAQAKPGDVWVCDGAGGTSHTELVDSNDAGKVTLIGSNNHPRPGDQQINRDTYSATMAGSYILAPPAGWR